MGKRSDFERIPHGLYPTPESAVLPLLQILTTGVDFDEPYAGDGEVPANRYARSSVAKPWSALATLPTTSNAPRIDRMEQRDE